MGEIVLFGTGKIAEVAHGYFQRDPQQRVVAFTCDRDYCRAPVHAGLPCVPFDEVHQHFAPDRYEMFIALGYHQLNALRAERYRQAKERGYRLASYIDAGAWVPASLEPGDNRFILDGVTVQPGAGLGNNVALWSKVVVGHHSQVGDHCWLAAGATLGGGCTVGEASFLGLQATVGHGTRVGARCLIGARTLLTKDVADERVIADADSPVLPMDSPRFLKISKRL